MNATRLDAYRELSPEEASRMAVTAVASDLEFWAHSTAVDGQVDLRDLTQTLDVIRQASIPDFGDEACDTAA